MEMCGCSERNMDSEPNIRDGKDDNSSLQGEVPMAALKILYTVLATTPPPKKPQPPAPAPALWKTKTNTQNL